MILPIVSAVVVAVTSIGVYSSLRSGFEYVTFINPAISESDKEIDDNLLFRDGVDSDVSNGRTNIWIDYLSLYKEVGLIGISPGNYMGYVLENHEDLFIVEDIRLNYPAKYESGIIYHPHNGYLYVFISTGVLGAAFLIAFIVLCAIRLIKKLMKDKTSSYLFICAFVLVVTGAISSLFDTGLFFQNNPHSSVFWIALGVLMKECSGKRIEG
jgi:O-antigen ligase